MKISVSPFGSQGVARFLHIIWLDKMSCRLWLKQHHLDTAVRCQPQVSPSSSLALRLMKGKSQGQQTSNTLTVQKWPNGNGILISLDGTKGAPKTSSNILFAPNCPQILLPYIWEQKTLLSWRCSLQSIHQPSSIESKHHLSVYQSLSTRNFHILIL